MAAFTYDGRAIEAEDGESVLSALLRHEVPVKSGCKAGACQSCLLRTQDEVPSAAKQGLDESLLERGFFLSCQTPSKHVQSVQSPGSEVFPVFDATLIGKELARSDVLILRLLAPGWEGSPGRFIRLIHPSGVRRAYSLATAAWESSDTVMLHVRLIPGGEMSELLRAAEAGDEYQIEGPLGKCAYRTTTQTEPILLIGSGTGLAPLYGILTDALQQKHRGPIYLYHGAASSDRLYFRDEIRALQSRGFNLKYTTCADQEVADGDRQGSPLAAALEDLATLDGYKVYLCGHPDLVRLAQKKCFLAGASLKDIAADSFLPS